MADNENIYGIKYEVNIDELKTSTAEATKKIKMANAEFKESSSRLEDWGSSTEGVGAKIKQLNTILEANKSKLANLKDEYNSNLDSIEKYDQQIAELKKSKEEAIAQYGKESTEVKKINQEIAKLERQQNAAISSVDKLKISILNQQASINKTEREIDQYNSKLNELQSENTQTVSSIDKLKNSINQQEKELADLKGEYANVILEQGKTSAEAQQLASKIRALNGDLKASKTTLNDVESEAEQLAGALDKAGEGAEEGSGGFTIMKGALADLTANAITSAISKVGEFVGALFSMSEATEEYRSMNAKIEGSAKSFGYSMDFAKEKYADFYAYLGDDQMSTNAITNLMGLGVSTKTVSDLANAGIGVWSAYGDSIPIEGLTESMNETAQVGKVTGSLADALNWAGISEDKFNEKLAKTTSVQKRADLIAQTLNSTYGKSKQQYDELTGSMTEANRAELELKESQAQLGASMEPVNTAINNLKAKALDLIAPAVEKFAQGILNVNNYLKEHPTVAKVVTAVVLGLATAFGVLAGALAIQGIIAGVTKAIALLNGTMMMNPYVLIASAIAGLVAGFIYLWNTSDKFRNFWIGLWDNIVKFVKKSVDSIVNFFTKTIPEAFNNFVTFISDFINNVTTSIVNFFTVTIPTHFNNFLDFVSGLVTSVTTFFSNMWKDIVNFFVQTIPAWIENVIVFFQKIPYYIGYMVGYVIGQFLKWGQDLWNFATVTVPQFINAVVDWFKQLPGKIWTWLVNTYNNITKWGVNVLNKAKEIGLNFVNAIVNFFKQLPGKIWAWLVNAYNNVATWGYNMLSKASEVGSNFINNVINYVKQLPSKVWTWLVDTANKVVSFGSDLARKGAEAGRKLFDSIVKEIKKIPGKMLEIGKNIVEGLWNGISNAGDWLWGKITGFADGIIDGITGVFKIKSPSRVMMWIGDMLTKGLGISIDKGSKGLVKKSKNVASNIVSTMKDKLGEKINVGYDMVENLKGRTVSAIQSLATPLANNRLAYAGAPNNVNNVTFNQYNTSPKAIDSLETYRNTQKQLKLFKTWKGGK